MRILRDCAVAGILALAASAAFAAPINLDTTLTPVGGTGSTGSGTFTAQFDPATATLSFTMTWTGLTADLTNSHIHLAPSIGANGPVLIPFFGASPIETITPAPPALPLGTSGTLTESITITDSTALANFLSGSAAGLLYVNVHTSNFPGGEIRGDLPATSLVATPEPGTALLLLPALAGFALNRRRRPRA